MIFFWFCWKGYYPASLIFGMNTGLLAVTNRSRQVSPVDPFV